MSAAFYLAAVVAVVSTLLVVTGRNAIHALLYLILSLLAVAVIFFDLGAPFVAALEVVVYAGAIMVLFTFVVMMLNVDAPPGGEARPRLRAWIGPSILALVLLAEMAVLLTGPAGAGPAAGAVPRRPVASREVGLALFGAYRVGVELASLLLLAGLVAAYHLGRRKGGRS